MNDRRKEQCLNAVKMNAAPNNRTVLAELASTTIKIVASRNSWFATATASRYAENNQKTITKPTSVKHSRIPENPVHDFRPDDQRQTRRRPMVN